VQSRAARPPAPHAVAAAPGRAHLLRVRARGRGRGRGRVRVRPSTRVSEAEAALTVGHHDVDQQVGQVRARIEVDPPRDAHAAVDWLQAPAVRGDARLRLV